MATNRFPDDFLFGVATSSYQIEGAFEADGKGLGIWDVFSRRPGAILNGDTGDVACDHYRLWESDLDRIAELGVAGYRFSISWPRILPDGVGRVEQRGLDFYERLVDGLLERGVAPMATLYHWDLPQALENEGGWADRMVVDAFAEYAGIVADRLGDRVPQWCTINEPWCIAHLGYGKGGNAPGRSNPVDLLKAAHHVNLAHGAATQVLRSATRGSIGIALNLQQLEPLNADAVDVTERANIMANDIFTGPMLEGAYPERLFELIAPLGAPSWIRPGDEALFGQKVDWIGLNYYTAEKCRPRTAQEGTNENGAWLAVEDLIFEDMGHPRTQMGWPVDPDGLVRLLRNVNGRYPDTPLYISENGAAYEDVVVDGAVHDPERRDFLHRHLAKILEAIEEGIPVAGYFAWSLLDNFEWSSGYARRFGLYHVDFETQERTLKDSGLWYQATVKARALAPQG